MSSKKINKERRYKMFQMWQKKWHIALNCKIKEIFANLDIIKRLK